MATVERERKYLVASMPDPLGHGFHLRQGYVATDGDVAVRIRDADGAAPRLTVKGGRGPVRTEVECVLTHEEFEALWPLTAGRRIDKLRHRVPVGTHVAEIDVFGGDLTGLVVVEVEFESDEAMAGFVPPDWFGLDVTDDARYANAALATAGRP